MSPLAGMQEACRDFEGTMMLRSIHTLLFLALLMRLCMATGFADDMERIEVSSDRKGFVLQPSGKKFVPWGFNYDHDEAGRLLEDYWEVEWPKVVADFGEMHELGANVVRVHLQVGKFLTDRDTPNAKALSKLTELLKLAEEQRFYLDLTGLGCYHKQDVPAWYDVLTEVDRWTAQATFWAAIAKQCESSPAVFCYDLMNEPVVPGGKRNAGDWLGPAFAGKHFVQVITLDQAGRPRPEIAKLWIKKLTSAIRQHDRQHLVTVGLVDWSLDRSGLTSGFPPSQVTDDLDFVCVHLYPESKKLDEAIETLKGFQIGKPVIIEETFPLKCSPEEFEEFVERSGVHATGWVGFYWGKTAAEYREGKTITDAVMLRWLEFFQRARQ